MSDSLPTIEHAGVLEATSGIPSHVSTKMASDEATPYSCSFCGVGDSGFLQASQAVVQGLHDGLSPGEGVLRIGANGHSSEFKVVVDESGRIEVATNREIAADGAVVKGDLEVGSFKDAVTAVVAF